MITLQHHLRLGPNFSRSKFCDAKLNTKYGVGSISVHRNILAAVSTKLEKRFEENLDSSEPIVIKNVDHEVLDKIIKYVYSGEVSLGTDEEYEDFCDGISLLKIDVGKEVKISPVVNQQHTSGSKVTVKTEYIEDKEEVIAEMSTGKHLTNLSISESSSNSRESGKLKRKSSSDKEECSKESSPKRRNRISSSVDINENQMTPAKDGTGVCHRKKDPSNDIEVVDVKEVVELFLQEVSLKTSKTQIRKYFSSFGEVQEVDMMDELYGRNSGLAVVKIVVDDQQKKELSELRHEINRRYVKVLFKQDLTGDDDKLDKRFCDNRSKLRLRVIGRAVKREAIRNFLGQKNVRKVFLKGEEGFVVFENFSIANGWNGDTIKVNKCSIKVYRSWKDSSRSKQWSGRRRKREQSRSPIRLGSRSRSKSRSRSGSTRRGDRLPDQCPW